MRNLFFALAFMLVGTFGFASNAEIGNVSKNILTSETDIIHWSESSDFDVASLTNIIKSQNEFIYCYLLDCTVSGTVSVGGASFSISITADTCKEAIDGIGYALVSIYNALEDKL